MYITFDIPLLQWKTTQSYSSRTLKMCTLLELVFPLLKIGLKKIIREEFKDKDVYLNVIYIIHVRKKIKTFKMSNKWVVIK